MPLINFIFFLLLLILPFSTLTIYLTKGLMFINILFIVVWLYTDFFSGILHIVFDNENVNIPYFTSLNIIIKNIAHDFQYHHKKVTYAKTINEIYEFILEIKYLIITTFMIPFFLFGNSLEYFELFYVSQMLLAFGVLLQLSHRNSHMPTNLKSSLFIILEKTGIIMSKEYHHQHHTTYDRNFPILSGKTSPLVNYLYNNIKSERFFQILCLFLSIFGGYIGLVMTNFLMDLIRV